MLLKSWQEKLSYTLAKLLQGFRQQVTWLTFLEGNSLDLVYLNGDVSVEVKNL